MQPSVASPRTQAERLVAAGKAAEAVRFLAALAARNDPEALLTLGFWRLAGRLLPFSLGEARELFRRAGEAGSLAGAQIHVNFLASGTGAPADWSAAVAKLGGLARRDPRSRAQLELIRAMALTGDGAPARAPQGEVASESPHVVLFPGLLAAAECNWLAATAAPMMKPSVIVDERTGRQVPHPIRTSEGASFPWLLENPAVHALNRRIAAASGTAVDQGEPLQVLRYRPGQEYRTHFDAIAGLDNQRALTMLVYLNDDYEGGETSFPKANRTFRGRKGDGLLFRNIGADGRPDPASEHAGLPVRSGEKLIASRWIRERRLEPPAPKAAPSST